MQGSPAPSSARTIRPRSASAEASEAIQFPRQFIPYRIFIPFGMVGTNAGSRNLPDRFGHLHGDPHFLRTAHAAVDLCLDSLGLWRRVVHGKTPAATPER